MCKELTRLGAHMKANKAEYERFREWYQKTVLTPLYVQVAKELGFDLDEKDVTFKKVDFTVGDWKRLAEEMKKQTDRTETQHGKLL